MALSKEDYKDVKGAMGKALAKKVAGATRDGGKYPGYRTMTGSQRHNSRMDRIFSEAKRLNAVHDAGRATHAKEKHGGDDSTYSSCKKCFK